MPSSGPKNPKVELKPEAIGSFFQLYDAHTGTRVHLIELGATVTNLWCKDRHGEFKDVLLGCFTPVHFHKPHPNFNCIVGRYANRITNAYFMLNGKRHRLEKNIDPHHLHGGNHGFASRLWRGTQMGNKVTFRLESPDGDAGYPGDLEVVAIYELKGSTLRLEMTATTSAATPVNLSAHHYFNLSGIQGSSIYDHSISVNASHYLPVSDQLTQLGVIRPVDNSPFDLREERLFDSQLQMRHSQLELAGGFDHNFVIDGDGFRETARATHPATGRSLVVRSNQPGVQLYTSNTLSAAGKDLVRYGKHQGFCLETQQFPDAPNHANYPNAILLPGETYESVTEYEFGVV